MSTVYTRDRDEVAIQSIVMDETLAALVAQFLQEQQFREILEDYGLPVSNKVLLYGPTGCGKTMMAKAIATHLKKPLYVVNLATIISSKLGETAKNIQGVFKEASYENSIIFFDEFDSLGQIRDYDNQDSSEMKRIVNALLQLIDQMPCSSVLLAATNQLHMIDPALVRRFELRWTFEMPQDALLQSYYDSILTNFPKRFHPESLPYGVSFAEAKDVLFLQLKKAIIAEELQKK